MAAAATKYATGDDARAWATQNAFKVDVRVQPRWTTVYLAGELDLAGSPHLETILDRVAASKSDRVIVDLRELRFMDITGLHVLTNARHMAARSGRPLTVRNSRDQVRDLLRLVGELTAVGSATETLPETTAVAPPI